MIQFLHRYLLEVDVSQVLKNLDIMCQLLLNYFHPCLVDLVSLISIRFS